MKARLVPVCMGCRGVPWYHPDPRLRGIRIVLEIPGRKRRLYCASCAARALPGKTLIIQHRVFLPPPLELGPIP